jgi:outer membrane protein OmpA-like peptidoglycan-associated protein
MKRRTRHKDNSETIDIYPAFTDLMSNAFMILSLFLLLALFESQRLNHNLKEANQRLQSASPIVIDEQSGKFTFISNSAELTPELKQYILTQVIPAIQKTVKEHEIDFVQIIGHTDGAEINATGNLDRILENVSNGQQSVSNLEPGSNADLGLMRALAVVQDIERTGKLKNVKFRAYSAGQMYLPSGNLASIKRASDATRRRIEIRFIPPGKNTILQKTDALLSDR